MEKNASGCPPETTALLSFKSLSFATALTVHTQDYRDSGKIMG